jgi:hypothetical protein
MLATDLDIDRQTGAGTRFYRLPFSLKCAWDDLAIFFDCERLQV